MTQIVKKKDFFCDYFKNISPNISKNFKKEIYANVIDNIKEENLEINNNKISMIINLSLKLPTNIFNYNFKNNLVEYIKKKVESRAYYIFYIDFIDYNYILNYELPLIKKVGELFWVDIPVLADLLIFKKNDIVEMTLTLLSKYNEDKINIYATNEYIHCEINLKSTQIILKNNNTDVELLDQYNNKKYKNNDIINIKLIDFYNKQLDDCFTSKINCSGEIKI